MFMKTSSNVEFFDFNNYPKSLKQNNANYSIVGKIKYETHGMPIKGFVGLNGKTRHFNHKSKKWKRR